ncbi:type I-E CRISPR-associated protein Cse1/CasA [Streptomyces sp. NBC_01433]|uniref:type I-E CRISPR-associated protein Cse1/CasA n=1 Tax=Streptomyces sp. NBC_01433 TaxID=2903864 RepID=UPI002252FD7C|nr:type I-E CRISPR-associated protein Cse1/CasA [Streptomyces sp. NBC_01433]MCX4675659.1 type I-E CRISPR-associated protein Cse1/CasA [Streptomyces sp. NBC_01433]
MSSDFPECPTAYNELSAASRTAWGKHDRKTEEWLPLWRHMADSAAVAGRLWDAWVPANVKALVADVFPGGAADARQVAVYLACVHDIGKATPAFACQVDGLADRMRRAGLDLPYQKQFGVDRRMAPHGLAGQLLLQEWLAERFGWSGRASGQFAVVAGGHHGTPPDHQQIHDLGLHPRLLRTRGDSEDTWRSVQYELMDACARRAGVTERLADWQSVRLPQPVQVVLTAIVIVSDWIASASELFPYDPSSWSPLGEVGEARRLEAAWAGLDLPGPWAAEQPAFTAAELFRERFELPDGAAVRPVQEEAVRVARQMAPAGLLIIEAPMGEGKTEAAFAAAEILAARSGAGGVLVALPTRATGDAMFPRLLSWLARLPADGPRSVVLAHAKSALNEVWSGMTKAGHRTIAAVELDSPDDTVSRAGAADPSHPSGLHAHQWLRGRKKALLASFAVGTIDQVLFAGLKSRHLALRHLAVAGKVVIIDEVHAYDAYMSAYLDRVLEWLAAYRVPVVMLSATLPAKRRRELAAAYAGEETGALADALNLPDDAYPLITAAAPGGDVITARPEPASGRRTEVALERLDDDPSRLVRRLADELRDGGCALVVRNTVDRVLEAAEHLRDHFGADAVTVAHSRFLAADRARKDTDLRERFGPGGDRPAGPHIVVASQVVEQSLDIDFDLLVTDLAPVDLMLQRMGRLHRHPRTRPPLLVRARCLVTGVADWSADPPEPVRGSLAVYQGPHTLLRALAVLGPHLDGAPVVLPDHISPLVQAAYDERPVGPDRWGPALADARRAYETRLADKRERADVFRLGPVRRAGRPVFGWLDANAGDADDSRSGRAQVRDSEETLEVLVVQRHKDGGLTTVGWLDAGRGGLSLPEHAPPTRQAAEAVAASALTLPRPLTHPGAIDRTIAELERWVVPAWQVKECPWLAGELLLVLDEECRTRLAGFELHYSPADGLRTAPVGAPHAKRPGPMAPSFDLVSRPWLPVQREDGTTVELSLLDVFAQADKVRRLVGDLPTQELALLRLLLAILYDALDEARGGSTGAPAELEDWEELRAAKDPFGVVAGYLDRHRDRFDLLHAERPFFQVAGLHTAKNEVASLNRIVADVPNGEAFFSMRRPGVDRLGLAEAARWLVHTHAYDSSGIKSGMEGDARVKGGKVYPQGVGWAGGLGGVFAEGATLRETLLLNLIPTDEGILTSDRKADLPVWRRETPPGAGVLEADPSVPRPAGPRDLYTWQSRRLLLHTEGDDVTGVVLGYGDPLAPANRWKAEPMTGWRRSQAQEKKLGRPLIYLPRQHDPNRAAWRGLASLLRAQKSDSDTTGRGTDHSLPSGVVKWLSLLTNEDVLPKQSLIRTRLIGAVYGTQQSVVDEVVDDGVTLPVVLLHQDRPLYGAAAVAAVADAERAVAALGHLAGNLARAAGSEPGPPTDTARDLGFGALDGPYRGWLAGLGEAEDPDAARAAWQATARRVVLNLGRELLDSAGRAAAEGRVVELPQVGKRWVDSSRADLWFRTRINKVLPKPPPDSPDSPDSPAPQA